MKKGFTLKWKKLNLIIVVLGIVIVSIVGTKAATAIQSSMVTYNDTTVKETLDELIEKANHCESNSSSRKYLLGSKTYNSGESVTWAGLEWYVVDDFGLYTTLILKENYGTGAYSSGSSEYLGSTAYNQLNGSFLEQNGNIRNAITEGSLVVQGEYGDEQYYVRLSKKSELSSLIPNNSGTPFWTMSEDNDKLYLGSANGESINYIEGTIGTYYAGYSAAISGIQKSGAKTVTTQSLSQNPSETTVTYNSSVTIVNRPTSYGTVTNVTKANASGYCSSDKSPCPNAYCASRGQTYYTDTCSTSAFNYYVTTSWDGIAGVVCASQKLYFANGSCASFYQLNSETESIGYRPVVTVLEG